MWYSSHRWMRRQSHSTHTHTHSAFRPPKGTQAFTTARGHLLGPTKQLNRDTMILSPHRDKMRARVCLTVGEMKNWYGICAHFPLTKQISNKSDRCGISMGVYVYIYSALFPLFTAKCTYTIPLSVLYLFDKPNKHYFVTIESSYSIFSIYLFIRSDNV